MKGVLLMTYGTPSSMDNVVAYYTDIMGGKRPTEDQIKVLVKKYEVIGGTSPLCRITEDQAKGLQEVLEKENSDIRVYFGMKHSKPFLKDAVLKSAKDGIRELVCIALAPHYSITGIGGYESRVNEANASISNKVNIKFVKEWHMNPNLIALWSKNITEILKSTEKPFVVFSAHSLPEKIEDKGPYKKQLLETAAKIAEIARIENYGLAFQSQSSRGEKWYGPTIPELIEQNRAKSNSFIIAPIGFVSDNMEILYDLDISCKTWAAEKNIELRRAKMPNTSKMLISALKDVVKENYI
jgi:ferrochelatase